MCLTYQATSGRKCLALIFVRLLREGELLRLALGGPGIPVAVELPAGSQVGVRELARDEVFGQLFEVVVVGPAAASFSNTLILTSFFPRVGPPQRISVDNSLRPL